MSHPPRKYWSTARRSTEKSRAYLGPSPSKRLSPLLSTGREASGMRSSMAHSWTECWRCCESRLCCTLAVARQATFAAPPAFGPRMLEVLRKSPVLHVGGGKTVTFKNIRQPAKTLSLSAEAVAANGDEKPVAIVFGPENGAIIEKLVFEAAREAHGKSYSHLYVIGFAIQPNARNLIEDCEAAVGIPATHVQEIGRAH